MSSGYGKLGHLLELRPPAQNSPTEEEITMASTDFILFGAAEEGGDAGSAEGEGEGEEVKAKLMVRLTEMAPRYFEEEWSMKAVSGL